MEIAKNIDPQLDTYGTPINILEFAQHIKNLADIIANLGERMEGNMFYNHTENKLDERLLPKQLNIIKASKNATSIMEIGVNAGHSLLLMLYFNPNVTIQAFDICSHKYVKPCVDYLNAKFNNRVKLIVGDSTKRVPEFIKSTELKFDLIHVDGGHELNIATADLNNSLKLLAPKGIIIFDDTQAVVLNNLFTKFIATNNFEEITDKFVPTVRFLHRIAQKKV